MRVRQSKAYTLAPCEAIMLAHVGEWLLGKGDWGKQGIHLDHEQHVSGVEVRD